jgi:hypothetical protein
MEVIKNQSINLHWYIEGFTHHINLHWYIEGFTHHINLHWYIEGFTHHINLHWYIEGFTLFMTARCSAIHSWRSWWSWRLQLMMVSCSRDGWYRERMRIDKSEFWRMVRGVSGCVLSLVLLLKLSRLLGWLLGYWLYEASWWPYLPLVVARGQAVVTYFLQSWFDVNHQ